MTMRLSTGCASSHICDEFLRPVGKGIDSDTPSVVRSERDSEAVSYVLLDYVDAARIVGTLRWEPFLAGYCDHEQWIGAKPSEIPPMPRWIAEARVS